MKKLTLFILINVFFTITVNATQPSKPYFVVEKSQTNGKKIRLLEWRTKANTTLTTLNKQLVHKDPIDGLYKLAIYTPDYSSEKQRLFKLTITTIRAGNEQNIPIKWPKYYELANNKTGRYFTGKFKSSGIPIYKSINSSGNTKNQYHTPFARSMNSWVLLFLCLLLFRQIKNDTK